ncbi:MAG: penicillin-binding protein 1C [Ottowia sp.]
MPPLRPYSRARARTRALIASALLALAAACPGSALAVPGFGQVKADYQSSETWLLDRDGQRLHRLRTRSLGRSGDWVALADISPALQRALILSEDKRFYEHSGVDWQAVGAAAWANLWNTRTRGASTLTMQLAGLLDEDLRLGSGGRSLRQKLGQAALARRLEASWRKDQILEAYLNLVPLRGELIGLDAISRTLFDKAPHGLDLREAALIAALVRAPNAAPERVTQRACGVLTLMQPGQSPNEQRQDCLALELLATAALPRRAWPASHGPAPHIARRLIRQASAGGPAPATVPSTLHGPTQRLARQTLEQHLLELQSHQVQDGAVIVLDNASGDVLAWVGSSGSLSHAAEVDGVTALRQPGSTLKPLLYAQAIAERRITAATLLHDWPAHLPTAGGLYIPRNHDGRFHGWVSARLALASSLNIPAVRVLDMVTPEAFQRQLQRLGLNLPQPAGYYGLSLALGSAEVSLLNLANAYRALANGGRICPIRLHPGQPATPPAQCPQVIAPDAAYIVSDILSDRNARALTFGLDSVLATRFWSAVKTGTSKDMRDNWVVGYSPRHTVAVWVGNADGQPMRHISGAAGAAPVWAALMRHLHTLTPPAAPPAAPATLERIAVRFHTPPQDEAPRQEWFLPGTGQTLFAIDEPTQTQPPQTAQDPLRARISSPAQGAIIALDPDIPPAHQRLRLSASLAAGMQPAALLWQVQDKTIARGPQTSWLPPPGRHTLHLRTPQGQTLDSVQIEVRPAPWLPRR